jgi:hypothetical protein
MVFIPAKCQNILPNVEKANYFCFDENYLFLQLGTRIKEGGY